LKKTEKKDLKKFEITSVEAYPDTSKMPKEAEKNKVRNETGNRPEEEEILDYPESFSHLSNISLKDFH
jgi:hypothetical protein